MFALIMNRFRPPSGRQPLWRRMVRSMLVAIFSVVALAGLATLMLFLFQSCLIYHPRTYGDEYPGLVSRAATEVCYQTGAGRQTALYVKPQAAPDRLPDRMWILFNGNASLALDWLDLLAPPPDPRAGYLLIEYPGYGRCAGKPSPATILESTERAMATLATQLDVPATRLYQHCNILGYSLGTAPALQLAARIPVEHVVLVAPFTSTLEMARRTVGWPLYHMLSHRFDNVARLAELYQRPDRPLVTIIHGDNDGVIPVKMSRRIAQRWPDWIQYHELSEVTHQLVGGAGDPYIRAAMTPTPTRTTIATR